MYYIHSDFHPCSAIFGSKIKLRNEVFRQSRRQELSWEKPLTYSGLAMSGISAYCGARAWLSITLKQTNRQTGKGTKISAVSYVSGLVVKNQLPEMSELAISERPDAS